jgi:hypothetical protein
VSFSGRKQPSHSMPFCNMLHGCAAPQPPRVYNVIEENDDLVKENGDIVQENDDVVEENGDELPQDSFDGRFSGYRCQCSFIEISWQSYSLGRWPRVKSHIPRELAYWLPSTSSGGVYGQFIGA